MSLTVRRVYGIDFHVRSQSLSWRIHHHLKESEMNSVPDTFQPRRVQAVLPKII